VSEPDAHYFSGWYAAMGEAPDKDRLWTRLLGLPSHLVSTSAVTGSAPTSPPTRSTRPAPTPGASGSPTAPTCASAT
jgi:hypothetical protein